MPLIGEVSTKAERKAAKRERRHQKKLARAERKKRGGFAELPGENLGEFGLAEFDAQAREHKSSQDRLFASANQTGLQEAIGSSRERSGKRFDSSVGQLERRQGDLGLRLSERQKRSQNRRIGLGRKLANVSGTNTIRRQFSNESKVAARAGQGLADQAFGIEGQIGGQLAAGAAGRRAAQVQAKADKKSATNSMIGTVVGVAAMFSSEDFKHDKRRQTNLLEKLKKVRIDQWKYVGDDTDHIGPYAEEFNEVFGVGQDSKQQISIIDAIGVTLGAVKELSERVDART